MITILIKIVLKLLLILGFAHVSKAQQPLAAGYAIDRTYRGYWTRPGVPSSEYPTWFIMQDSTWWHIKPLNLSFDTLIYDPSRGNPDNFLWVDNSNGKLYWSRKDSLRLYYSQLDGTPTIPSTTSQLTNNSGFLTGISNSMVNVALGYTPYNSSNPTGYITILGARNAISLTTLGTSGTPTYDAGTGVLNIPDYSILSDSLFSVTRAIDSTITYRPNPLKQTTVFYNIKISCSATIGSNSSGKVLFQYSTDDGSTWIDAGEVENSNTVTLAIALNSVTTQTGFICWTVPPNALCRLKPTSTGTTTITWIRGQEKFNGY